jgi:2-dehydropantoate 2-reductase
MKIAVVGCGALGSYYGALLCRDGHETHFLLRSDYDVVRAQGVHVRSDAEDFLVHPHCARVPEEIGVADLVLIGLKTTANSAFPKLLPPLVGPHTSVLTLQNGLGNEEALAKLFPSKQILGGLCFVCLNRTDPGVIQHIAHGKIVFGEYHGGPIDRTHLLAQVLTQAGIPCEISPNLALAHWQKLVWNIPFNGLGVASAAGIDSINAGCWDPQRAPLQSCLTTDKLLAAPDWTQVVRELMHEVIDVSCALGHVIDFDYADFQIRRTRDMGAYRASTLVDFEARRPLELGSLFLEPLRLAKTTSVPTPRLQALCQVLTDIADHLQIEY